MILFLIWQKNGHIKKCLQEIIHYPYDVKPNFPIREEFDAVYQL